MVNCELSGAARGPCRPHFKRVIAFSSIGAMLLGIGCVSERGAIDGTPAGNGAEVGPASRAGRSAIRSLDSLRAQPLHSFSEPELDVYLKWLSGQELSLAQRVELLARKAVGQRYRLHLLGEFPIELIDPDPMYCLSASDCVTFVEQTYAMALSGDWASFFSTLQRIRYKDGDVGMLTRNHFVEADWNVNNAWLFEDVTGRIGSSSIRRMELTIDRAAFFEKKQRGLGESIPNQPWEDVYIPRDSLPAVLPLLRTADVVEFVRGDPANPYVGHMGLIARAKDGKVVLIHSTKPAVRAEPLIDYVTGRKNVMGVKVLRPKDGAGAAADLGTRSH